MRSLTSDSVRVLKRINTVAFHIVLQVESILLAVMPVHAYAYHVVQGVW